MGTPFKIMAAAVAALASASGAAVAQDYPYRDITTAVVWGAGEPNDGGAGSEDCVEVGVGPTAPQDSACSIRSCHRTVPAVPLGKPVQPMAFIRRAVSTRVELTL